MNENAKINEFIESGSIITLKVLKEYAMDIIGKENLENSCNDVTSIAGTRNNMQYDPNSKVIEVNLKGCISSIKSNFLSLEYNNSFLKLVKHANNWCCSKNRNNIINMYFLYSMNHELHHVRQYDLMNRLPEDNMSKLLSLTNDLIKLDYFMYDGENYYFYHDKFLIEYQAIAHGGLKTIEEIINNYKNILSRDELEFLNIYIARRLLNGYIGIFDNKRKRTTPIKHLIYISGRIFANIENVIRDLEANEVLQNNVDDILLGRDVPTDILNKIDDVAKGKVKTDNFFNSIYSKTRH